MRVESQEVDQDAKASSIGVIEFFPPADEAGVQDLLACAERLAAFQPSFVSVTYGADGSTRTRTAACVQLLRDRIGLPVAPHLTCVGASRPEVLEVARGYARAGIRQLVALRGDPVDFARGPGHAYRPHPEGFAFASDLVAGLREAGDFDISVAAYPEIHPECDGLEAEIANLMRKQQAGAHRAITQFFFEPGVFLRYRDRCVRAGIRLPLVPGILPIHRMPQLVRFAARCGASVPEWLRRRFEGLDDDPATRNLIAAHVAIEQVERLRAEGVDEFHFYTLNRAELAGAICHALDVKPQAVEARVA